jgi:hypothetical protein
MNSAALHGTEKKTQRKDLSISYWLAGIYKRYNSTWEEKKERKGFSGEGGGE